MKKLLFIALVLITTIASAQYTESLTSDRPGQALSTGTVGKNVFQIQAGVDYFDSSAQFYPSSYFRYGLSEGFELNSGFILSGNNFGNELEVFTIGARFHLNKNRSKFQSSLQLSYDFGGINNGTHVAYILGSSLSENLSYTVNLGIDFDRDFAFNNGIYIFNLSYAFNSKMGIFIEPFGTFLNDSFQFNLDSGFYYLLNNNLQLDVLIGESNGFFLGAGVTWRIPPKNK